MYFIFKIMYFILQNIVNSKFVEIFVKVFYKLYRE